MWSIEKYDEVMRGVKTQTKHPTVGPKVSGMLSRPESHWLLRIPKVIGDGVYVELGTLKGRSAGLLSATMRDEGLDARLITVDIFDRRGVSPTLRKDGDSRAEVNFASVKQAFETTGLSGYVQIVKSTTVDASKKFSDLRCDFLFIDANHSYDGVKADFDTWSCKLKQDAILSFHDSNLPGVSRLLSGITDWEEFDRVDTLSVWRRA